MKYFGKLELMVVSIIALFIWIPSARAQTPFDVTFCAFVTFTNLTESPELTVFGLEAKGIAFSNHENKVFDNMSIQWVAIGQRMPGKSNVSGYCKFMDPDGHFIIMEDQSAGREATYTFLHGTGKWKGIKGGGKAEIIATGKPIVPGTRQSCRRFTGTFELPK